MPTPEILRGEIWLFDFGKTGDQAIEKYRPVVVIQNNFANLKSGTIIIAALRTNPKVGQLPTGVKIETNSSNGLRETSYADLGHIYTVDRTKLLKKIGIIIPAQQERINEAIKISLALTEFR